MVKKSEKKVVSEKSASVEKPVEKASALASAMVRISPDEAQYVKMHTEDGWFQGVGAPRLPELNKDIRLTLSLAVKTGHALFANAGGIRILKNANGKGGACFIEKKNMSSGNELYLLNADIDKSDLEKAGLVVTREAKGFYVKPRMTNNELAFEVIAAKFGNNHGPMNFEVHDWPGYVVTKEEKKTKKVKATTVKSSEKVEAKVPMGKVLTKAEKPTEKAPKMKEKSGKKTTEEPRVAVA